MQSAAEPKAYLIGGGLSALSAAAYLIRDAQFKGEDITVFEALPFMGGSLDAFEAEDGDGYVMRGFRMLEDRVYSAVFDLLSFIPSLEDSSKTVLEEFKAFNEVVKTYSRSRLVKDGVAIDGRPLKMTLPDRLKLLRLLMTPERKLEKISIGEYFSPEFFTSNLWYQFGTTFSFTPWHSVEEMKRYILRFLHTAHQVDTQECIRSTPLNQFESIVLPVKAWLKAQGVQFKRNCVVTDVDLSEGLNEGRYISEISFQNGRGQEKAKIKSSDLVLITTGSMTADHTMGSMERPPAPMPSNEGRDWMLWEKLAAASPEFGAPATFNGDRDKTKWVSFTVTVRDPRFLERLEAITQRAPGTEGPITLIDSSWLISFGIPKQPHFKDQPEGVTVFWGYGLFPDEAGDFVGKPMEACSGREILVELLRHLKLDDDLDGLLERSTCIPCLMPYITSQFMPRSQKCRPKVVPEGAENFAFIGQYCEIPDDIVFTLDYSVRSAQIAVYTLLGLDKAPTPIYKGARNPLHVLRTLQTTFR